MENKELEEKKNLLWRRILEAFIEVFPSQSKEDFEAYHQVLDELSEVPVCPTDDN